MDRHCRIFSSVALAIMITAFAQHIDAQDTGSEKNDEVDFIVHSILTIRDAGIEGDSLTMEKEILRLSKSNIDLEDEPTGREAAPDADIRFMQRWDEAVTRMDSIKDSKSDGQQRGNIMGNLIIRPQVTTRRFYLKKGASGTFTTHSRHKLSVAVVPERGGLVTMRMHASNSLGYDRNFDDSEKFHQGKSYRKRVVDLPEQPTKVEIEVINRSAKDISYILITK